MPRMSDETELMQAISRLRKQSPQNASAGSEAKVIAGFRAARQRLRWARVSRIAAAACLLVTLGWLVLQDHSPGRRPVRHSNPIQNFVELPYAQSGVPLEDGLIVRMEVKPSDLQSWGLRVVPLKTNGKISADFLVGQDGVPRAVRLMQ